MSPNNKSGVLASIFFVGALFVALVVSMTYDLQRKLAVQTFNHQVAGYASLIDKALFESQAALWSLSSLLHQNANTSYSAFQLATDQLRQQQSYLSLFLWAPKVSAVERIAFEQRIRDHYQTYVVKNANYDLGPVSGDYNAQYFPVDFVVPAEGNEAIVGMNLLSYSALAANFQQATDLATPQMLKYAEFTEGGEGLLVAVMPFYKGLSQTLVSRRANIKGFVLVVADINLMLDQLLPVDVKRDMQLAIRQVTNEQNNAVLVSQEANHPLAEEQTRLIELRPLWNMRLTLEAIPTQQALSSNWKYSSWLIVVIGLIANCTLVFYLKRRFDSEAHLVQKVSAGNVALEFVNEQLEENELVDSLTGIANRRGFDDFLELEWHRSVRFNTPIALILIKINQFKEYNLFYGRSKGDDCLRQLSQVLKEAVKRKVDLLARYSGDAFAIVVCGSDTPEVLAKRCLENIRKLKIPHSGTDDPNSVTVSLGCCSCIPTSADYPIDLIKATGDALLQAKTDGGNSLVATKLNPDILDHQRENEQEKYSS